MHQTSQWLQWCHNGAKGVRQGQRAVRGGRVKERQVCELRRVVAQSCYSGVTELLQWNYSGTTVVLQWCYSGVTVVLQWCYSGVTHRLKFCCKLSLSNGALGASYRAADKFLGASRGAA
jgi:hypothetical protein